MTHCAAIHLIYGSCLIRRPLIFATALLGLATLLTYGGRWSWACELLVTFRTHLALLVLLVILIAGVTRHWRILGVAAVVLALDVWPMFGAFVGASWPATPDARPVRLVEFNVYVRNRDLAGAARYVDSLAPDIVVLEEVTASSAQRLASLLPKLPHRFVAIDEGLRGVMILSRWPLMGPQRLVLDAETYGVRADVDLGDRRLRVYGVHLDWPIVRIAAAARNAQLSALGGELAGCRGACVIVGDFNTVPWSSHFRDMRRRSGFRDCVAGRGLQPTWPEGLLPPLRIRIDQCLAAPGVSVADVRVGGGAGSDHLATINDLLVAKDAQKETPASGRRP
jgi:endonuclease/exonuclease/phosphatase (EEP) superfamily protein YafD